jgi:hypothetical protein
VAQQTISDGERDIFLEAPPTPARRARFFVIVGIALLYIAS